MDPNVLIPQGFNTVLILIVGFLLQHELSDIKHRIVRMENKFMNGEEEPWEL